jgi:hypothetical protein
MNEEVDVQPSGVKIEKTLEVVEKILVDPIFAVEVAAHNNWDVDLDPRDIALRFLASRYQWSISLLSLQTANLRNELSGLASSVLYLEDKLAGR